VRPGALPYLFPEGQDVSSLLSRLAKSGWRGQIVGPHGSGKSTLLATLRPAIEAAGKRVIFIELHDGQRRLPIPVSSTLFRILLSVVFVRASTHPTYVLIIDGYEQLPWWRRRLFQCECRRLGLGLLVTSHKSVGLPEVFRTQVDMDLARRVVAKLLAGREGVITKQEIDACARRHDQDLREAMFELYDLFEQHRKGRR